MPDTAHSKSPKPDVDTNKSQNEAKSDGENEGEGSRTGARQYDEGATKAAKDPAHVKKAAEEAKKALEGPEGDSLRKAEEQGKKHQH